MNLNQIMFLGALIALGGSGLYKGGALVFENVVKAKHHRYMRHVDFSKKKDR